MLQWNRRWILIRSRLLTIGYNNRVHNLFLNFFWKFSKFLSKKYFKPGELGSGKQFDVEPYQRPTPIHSCTNSPVLKNHKNKFLSASMNIQVICVFFFKFFWLLRDVTLSGRYHICIGDPFARVLTFAWITLTLTTILTSYP